MSGRSEKAKVASGLRGLSLILLVIAILAAFFGFMVYGFSVTPAPGGLLTGIGGVVLIFIALVLRVMAAIVRPED